MKRLIEWWKDWRKDFRETNRLRKEKADLQDLVNTLKQRITKQQEANQQLLLFIHRSHRLNVPFADGTLRKLIYSAQLRNGQTANKT